MKCLITAFLLMLALAALPAPAPALAQDPTPASGGGAITVEETPHPYTIAPIPFDQDASPVADLDPFSSPDFVNTMGSVILTLFVLADSQNVLSTFVVVLIALWLLWRIHKFATTSTPSGTIDLSFADQEDEAEEFVHERRYSSNPYKIYKATFIKKRN